MALSPRAKAAMFSQETEEVLICLVTISHPNAPVTRVSSDPTLRSSDDPLQYITISRGQTYTYIPFTMTPPVSGEDSDYTAKLVLSNVERELIGLLRGIPEPTRFLLEMVLGSTPDVVEMALSNLELLHFHYTAEVIELSLGYRSLSQEPFPFLSFTPGIFPGLFK